MISVELYNNIIIGVLGLKNQRNFISEYYPEGKHIVEMDDDIREIMQLVVRRNSKSSKSGKRSKSVRSGKSGKSGKSVRSGKRSKSVRSGSKRGSIGP